MLHINSHVTIRRVQWSMIRRIWATSGQSVSINVPKTEAELNSQSLLHHPMPSYSHRGGRISQHPPAKLGHQTLRSKGESSPSGSSSKMIPVRSVQDVYINLLYMVKSNLIQTQSTTYPYRHQWNHLSQDPNLWISWVKLCSE